MKESKTIQVYPDDSIINETIHEYECLGWELVNNQRCQEYEGQTYGFDGSSTKHYSTFNKITFSREKNVPWYGAIVKIEADYDAVKAEMSAIRSEKPQLRNANIGDILLALLPPFGLWFFIGYGVAKKKHKKKLKEYEQTSSVKLKSLELKKSELLAKAESIITNAASV